MSHSQFQTLIFTLTHAWLNLWDERMTTGRINQIRIQTEWEVLLDLSLVSLAFPFTCTPFSGSTPNTTSHPYYSHYQYQPLHMPNDLPHSWSIDFRVVTFGRYYSSPTTHPLWTQFQSIVYRVLTTSHFHETPMNDGYWTHMTHTLTAVLNPITPTPQPTYIPHKPNTHNPPAQPTTLLKTIRQYNDQYNTCTKHMHDLY